MVARLRRGRSAKRRDAQIGKPRFRRGIDENRVDLFVQLVDLFLNRSSPFELVDRQVVYIHAASKYSKPVEIKC